MSNNTSKDQTVCKPCPHFPGYYNGIQLSDRTCPYCQIERLRAALELIAPRQTAEGLIAREALQGSPVKDGEVR